jgi:hypothetical protein
MDRQTGHGIGIVDFVISHDTPLVGYCDAMNFLKWPRVLLGRLCHPVG